MPPGYHTNGRYCFFNSAAFFPMVALGQPLKILGHPFSDFSLIPCSSIRIIGIPPRPGFHDSEPVAEAGNRRNINCANRSTGFFSRAAIGIKGVGIHPGLGVKIPCMDEFGSLPAYLSSPVRYHARVSIFYIISKITPGVRISSPSVFRVGFSILDFPGSGT